jgi:predicted acylesterase/phospholipase RssA
VVVLDNRSDFEGTARFVVTKEHRHVDSAGAGNGDDSERIIDDAHGSLSFKFPLGLDCRGGGVIDMTNESISMNVAEDTLDASATADRSQTGDRRLAGVFEGGGAKGIAYAGALHAVAEAGLWFGAVAGASAGAITATLIGAGFGEVEIGDLSAEAMACLRSQLSFPSGRWKRTRFLYERLKSLAHSATASAATSDPLRIWLQATLRGRTGKDDATFADLYDATRDANDRGIELTIVAVDIHHRQHRVFNHVWTPDVSVASAAVASSSIPFALPPLRLVTADNAMFASPIVDGGVWTNFPTFVFADPEFRAYHGLPKMSEMGLQQIGFLLDETPENDEVDRHRATRFVDVPQSLRREVKAAKVSADAQVVAPSEMLLSFDDELIRSAITPGTTDRRSPRGRTTPQLATWLIRTSGVPGFRATRRSSTDGNAPVEPNGLFTAVRMLELLVMPLCTFILCVASLFAAAIPAWATIQFVHHGVWWTHVLWGWLLVVACVVGVAMLMLFVGVLVGHALLYWSARRFGALVASTYVAGSGAPYWTGRAGSASGLLVVRLPIPPSLRTTTFDLDESERRTVVSDAHAATVRAVATIDVDTHR